MLKRISKRVKSVWAELALLSAEMLVIVIVFILALMVFAYLVRKVIVLDGAEFDQRVFKYLETYVTERNSDIMQFFTLLGSHNFLIPANLVLIAYFLFIRKHRWYSIKIPAIALSSLGLMFGLKHLFNRQRPNIPLLEEAKGLSFPSGHALFSVTFYGLLIYIIFKTFKRKDLRWTLIGLLILLIIIIGFTRIYLRVHYTTDVIAGFCVGFLWLVLAVWILDRIETYSRRELAPAVEPQPGVPSEPV